MVEDGNNWEAYLSHHRTIERRETQLWWLAIGVIALLAVAVVAMDLSNVVRDPGGNRLAMFDNAVMRYALLAAAFLICAYFRDTLRRLRQYNARLLSDLRKQSDLLERRSIETTRLKDISDHLTGNLDVQSGLDLLLGMAMDISGAQSASILLADEQSGKLDRLSVRSLSADGKSKAQAEIKQSIAQWVVDRGKGLLINSDTDEVDIADSLKNEGNVSTVLAPISVGGKALGVLSVAGKVDGGQFIQEDLDTICTLANQAALAIERMHLYRKLQEQVVSLRRALHEVRQAQAGLIQSEKLASIGQLAGGMAHEINNPLLIILGRAEMLLMDTDPSNPCVKDLEVIKSETQRIADIVQNLLSFSRVERSGILSPVDVNEVIERALDLVEMQEESNKIATIKRLSTGLPPVYAEKGELQQVFMNIAINAFQAMKDQGGKLIVETSQDDAGYVVAKFADTGPGVAAENMGKIFEPFFTTKPELEGTGLGLSVSRSIVEKYGGRVEVETRLGKGANFIVKLPVAEEGMKDLPKAA